MRAAIGLLQERDGVSFSMRELAARVGYAVTAVYRCYETRGHLLRMMTLRLFSDCETSVGAIPEGAVEKRLSTFADRYIAWAVDHPAEYSLMYTCPEPEAQMTEEELEQTRAMLRTVEAILVDSGINARSGRVLANFYFASVHGMVQLALNERLDGVDAKKVAGFLGEHSGLWIGGLLKAAE